MADGPVSVGKASARRGSGGVGKLVGGAVLLLVAAVAAALFLVALGLVEGSQVLRDPGLTAAALGWLEDGGLGTRLLTAGVSLVVGLASLWLLLGRLSGDGRRSPSHHVLIADEQGVVLVARDGVAGVARNAAESAPGVIEADVRITSRGPSAVGLSIRVSVLPGADVKRAGAGARDRAADAVERLVGLEVHDTAVHVEVIEPEDVDRMVS